MSAGGELVVTSMDDEALFGPVLHTYSFRRGIAGGWLKDYRIVVAALADSQVAELLDGTPGLVGEGGVPVRMAAAQAALAMTAAQFGLRRCLAFMPRVAQARQFARTLPATLRLLPSGQRPPGEAVAGFVHGDMIGNRNCNIWDIFRRRSLRAETELGCAALAIRTETAPGVPNGGHGRVGERTRGGNAADLVMMNITASS